MRLAWCHRLYEKDKKKLVEWLIDLWLCSGVKVSITVLTVNRTMVFVHNSGHNYHVTTMTPNKFNNRHGWNALCHTKGAQMHRKMSDIVASHLHRSVNSIINSTDGETDERNRNQREEADDRNQVNPFFRHNLTFTPEAGVFTVTSRHNGTPFW